jgi:hypothetical protein
MIVVYAYLALVAAAGLGLVALARRRRLRAWTILLKLAGHVLGAALFAVGAVAWLFNGYGGGECCERWDTLGFAVPVLIAAAVLLLAAWWPLAFSRRRRTR